MNTKQFIVTDFGAVPYVEAAQTEAIQKALDACFLAGEERLSSPRKYALCHG